MTDEEDYQRRMALKAEIGAWLNELKAADAARRAEARARGEPLYPDPGFKASRLVEPDSPFEDFGYLTDADLRRTRRNPTAGPAPDPREAAARERAAMMALKARRGCPACVAQNYVEALRRDGAWWNDIPL
jgi:hypothetical protein